MTVTAEPTTAPVPAAVDLSAEIAAGIDAYVRANLFGIVLRFQDAIAKLPACKVFTGTIVSVVKEVSSNRVVVTLQTGTERAATDAITKQPLPAGQEQIRTERLDNPDGLAVAQKARSLKGQFVTVWVEVESVNESLKVRVLRHLEPRPAPRAN